MELSIYFRKLFNCDPAKWRKKKGHGRLKEVAPAFS